MAIKVSQATIDNIKKMGMAGALKAAKGISAPGGRNVADSKEFLEGVRRMYGQRRFDAATGAGPKSTSTGGYPKPMASKGTPMRPVSKAAASKPASKPKTNTTSNPFTAAHNALSPYGNKNQKYVSGIPAAGMAGRSKPGKPSVGEQISSIVGGVLKGKGLPSRGTASSVAATNAKRMGITVAEYNKRLSSKKK